MPHTIVHYILIFLSALLLLSCGSGDGSSILNYTENNNSIFTPNYTEENNSSSTPNTTALIDADSETPYIGIGIGQLSYYDGAQAMVDLVYESEFRTADWGYDVGADSNGAPTKDFQMIFCSKRLPSGTYKLVFTGQAVLGISASAEDPSGGHAYIQNQQYSATTNTTTADLVIPSVIYDNAWISFSNTRRTATSTFSDGVTQLHLWRPGYPVDGSAIFTREFIAVMQKFHIIRGMELVSANGNGTITWSQRPSMRHLAVPDNGKGQPWELLILLANTTNKDLWINVPTRADDDYLRKLAQLIRYGSDGINPYTSIQAHPIYPPLNPELRIYIEYGNELWNSGYGFQGFGWSLALADLARQNLNHPINYDNAASNDRYLAHRRWIAYRSSQISLMFRSVFGDVSMMSRVRPILASQVGDANIYLSEGLKWAEGFYGKTRTAEPFNPMVRKVSDIWWGGGGAAYYDSLTPPNDISEVTMTAYFQGLPNKQFAKDIATDAIWTRGYGLKSVAYEGGPGPGGSALGSVGGSRELSATYNADPRMKARMLDAHQIYQENGGQMLMYYVYSGSEPWSFVNGLFPSLVSDSNTTKLQAIDTLRTQHNSGVTLGYALPATIWLHDLNSSVIMNSGGGWGYDSTAYRLSPRSDSADGEFALIPVRSERQQAYNFFVSTYDAPAGSKLEMLVDGIAVGVWQLEYSNNGQLQLSKPLTITLKAGLHIIRIRSLQGTVWIKELRASSS